MISITKRIKNEDGITIAYEIYNKQTSKHVILDSNEIQKRYNLIDNAILLKCGEFKAKPGFKIETVMQYNKVNTIHNISNTDKLINSTPLQLDYYGKDFINICKKIRRLAYSNKIRIEDAFKEHTSNRGNNTHMIKLIEACGVDTKDFIRGYLSVIQPFSLEAFQKKKDKDNNSIWICDIGYRVKLVIKIKKINEDEAILVSFHESNIVSHSGITQSLGRHDFSDKLCAVIVDKVQQASNMYVTAFTIQRGFIRNTINYTTDKYSNGVILIEYRYIKDEYQNSIDRAVSIISDTYYEKEKMIDFRIDVSMVSFLSSGFSMINNICLMIDFFSTYRESTIRRIIIDITNNILSEMPNDVLATLKEALFEKYGKIVGYENELYKKIEEFK